MDATATLLDQLRQPGLLEPAQLEEIDQSLLSCFPEPQALIAELRDRCWLTSLQADWLVQGRGHELVLGSYVLLEKLGEGGMGTVFKARHRNFGHIVALKLVRKERLTKSDAIKRFLREIRVAAQLNHPNIIRAFDADEINGAPFYTMEYVEGRDLYRLVKAEGPLPVAQACEYIRQAALGLQHAHERGLIHRDIKPHNLIVVGGQWSVVSEDKKTAVSALTTDHPPPTTVKILDMGLARHEPGSENADSLSTVTQEGIVMGTADYIAPEQARGSEAVDIRSDLYSLGATFYHLLAGQPPFTGGSMTEKLLRHQLQDPGPVERLRADVPPQVAAVVHKLLAKKPEDRYQTPAELADALANLHEQAAARPTSVSAGPTASASPEETKSVCWARAADPASTVDYDPTKHQLVSRRKRQMVVGGFVALVLSVSFLGLMLWRQIWPGSPTSAGTAVQAGPEHELKALQALAQDSSVPKAEVRDAIFAFCLKYPRSAEAYQAGRLLVGMPPLVNSIGMRFAPIPPGTFQMGSPLDEAGRQHDEVSHEVTITRPYYLSIYEVTQDQWQQVMDTNPSHFSAAGGGKDLVVGMDTNHFPVDNVSWQDAVAFCRKLTEWPEEWAARRKYRLPTEAEWEYACRGEAGRSKPFNVQGRDGSALSSLEANFNGSAPYGTAAPGPFLARTAAVGSYFPNDFGLYDLHGNLMEWCQDWYAPYATLKQDDPQGPATGTQRVLRGGTWDSSGSQCRAAARAQNVLGVSVYIRRGFRVVLVGS